MRIPLIPVLLLALPLAEIAGFVVVGQRIGALATIGLVLLAALAGFVLMRVQGISAFRRINHALKRGERPGRAAVDAFMILLAGILLIVPGFITDVIGLLLFIPWIRHAIWRMAGRRLAGGVRFSRFEMHDGGFSQSGEDVVDLDPDDFRRSDKERHGISRHPGKDRGQGL